MKVIKNIIEYLIAITIIPTIVLSVIKVTELKDVKSVQFELLSKEECFSVTNGTYKIEPLSDEEEKECFIVTDGTYNKLIENKGIIHYDIESNYPLITREEMDRATWSIGDIKNEIFIDENGQKRIRENVGKVTFDGSENWINRMTAVTDDGVHVIYSLIVRLNIKTPINFKQDLFGKSGVVLEGVRQAYANGEGVYMFFDGSRVYVYITIERDTLGTRTINEYLAQNPLTVLYELAVKNPKNKIIESSDLSTTSDYLTLVKPNDFSNNPQGLIIDNMMDYIDSFEVTTNWINVYPKDITVTELESRLIGKTLIYELVQPRLVEVYDFSTFKLTYDKNSIKVLFDIDDGYYLWEITNDDILIPIYGQYDLGNIWTVKFYVYEIQQPLIRRLVLLIPLIVISGLLLYMYDTIKNRKEDVL